MHEAVGFVEVRGDLGDELVAGDTDGSRQLRRISDVGTDAARDADGITEQADAGRDVEKGLVEGEALHFGRDAPKYFEDLLRDIAVVVQTGVYANRVGATLQRFAHWHCRAHAKLARLVACGRNDTTLPLTTDEYGLSRKLGVIALLDRGIERVHIDVQDGALVVHRPTSCAGQ